MKAFIIQVSVIWALILRETRTRFGAHRYFGLIWMFAEPTIHIMTLWTIFAVTGHKVAYGMPTPLFLLTGILPWLLFNGIFSRCLSAIDGNRALLYYPQVTPVDLVLARVALEAAATTVVLTIMLFAAVLSGFTPDIDDGVSVVAGFFLMAVLGMGLGLGMASWAVLFPTLSHIISPCVRVLYFASGVFFTAESVPEAVRSKLLLNPIMNLIDVIRGGFFNVYNPTHSSLSYAALFAFSTLALGLVSERMNRKRIVV